MPDEEYFAVVNDNPMAGNALLVLTRTEDSNNDIYRDQDKALDRRDELRESSGNPDINVYRVTVHEGSVEREEVAA
ncbi:hypothetical protein G3I44_14065 [Halogeometricum borinquense]|uniref:Uncharacterized protein n=1 Tax=Halogeometricum borinquense TaxID=60847 RepID=A0A6C0UII6_9EURY|nr:hypothetical protein [Halogeometricum borinquense]QIB75312.1 hypothetical protein G3I44_14065 [Halogeometricum borinquense]